jgi:nucleotide-binding universal stress UspA family protein
MTRPDMRIKNILCPVDFSAPSQRALEYAISLATSHDSQLQILHVVSPVIARSYWFPIDTGKVMETLKNQARQELEKLRQLASDAGMEAEARLRLGDVEIEILDAAEKYRADILVIGKHGRSTIERWFVGSVAEHLLRKSKVPMLIIGEGKRKKSIPRMERIIVTSDLSEDSAYALSYAAALARETQATVTYLHVMPVLPAGVGLPYEVSIPEAQSELDRLVPVEARKWCTIVTRVETGIPYQEILSIAEKTRANMLVMNTHGKSMLERALLGSTAERVIRGAPCPVLAIPPRKSSRKRPRTARSLKK